MNHRQRLGKAGEAAAARYLEERGYRIEARNARTPYGELDLVARKEAGWVIVEVKTRASRAFGNPETAITPAKRRHLAQAAQYYFQEQAESVEFRIDVISILVLANGQMEIEHFENAITGSE